MQQTIKRRPICRFTCLRLELVTRTDEAFMFFAMLLCDILFLFSSRIMGLVTDVR